MRRKKKTLRQIMMEARARIERDLIFTDAQLRDMKELGISEEYKDRLANDPRWKEAPISKIIIEENRKKRLKGR